MIVRASGKFLQAVAAFCLIWGGAPSSRAAELVCLQNGFCFQALSHAAQNGRIALQMGTGSVELAASDIVSVEEVKEALPLARAAQVSAVPVKAALPNPQALLSRAAHIEGLDGDFVRSVAQVESALKTEALSKKGALGLMQLMPGTARELAVDPSRADENALGGAKYLRSLLLRYHSNSALALAAYNAGPAAVDKYHGVPPYAETQQYVRRVTREYDRLHTASVAAKPTAVNKPTAKD